MNNGICCPPYWILIHECIISASRKLEKSSLHNYVTIRSKTKAIDLRSFLSAPAKPPKRYKKYMYTVYHSTCLYCCTIEMSLCLSLSNMVFTV